MFVAEGADQITKQDAKHCSVGQWFELLQRTNSLGNPRAFVLTKDDDFNGRKLFHK
jgi:hypothetical protein